MLVLGGFHFENIFFQRNSIWYGMCVHKIHKCGLLLATLAKILIKLARKGEKKGGRLMISCDILQNI